MQSIQLETIPSHLKATRTCKVGRIPMVGEFLDDGGDALEVRAVYIAINPKKGEPEAIVRVK